MRPWSYQVTKRKEKKHPSITFWVKTIGRNTALQSRHMKDAKQFLCKWHKIITQVCFGLNKSVMLWNSEGSRKKQRVPGSQACAWTTGEELQAEEIFTVTNGDRKTQRQGRFVKAVADWSPILSELIHFALPFNLCSQGISYHRVSTNCPGFTWHQILPVNQSPPGYETAQLTHAAGLIMDVWAKGEEKEG